MDLEKFVKETLLQVLRGIRGAADEVEEHEGRVSPELVGGTLQNIEFDVAVFASEDSATGGKAGIRVASMIGIGGKKEVSSSHRSESRIKFTVPVEYPAS